MQIISRLPCHRAYYVIIACLLIVFSGCGNNSKNEDEYNDITVQVHALVNQHRIGLGLDSLDWNEVIAEQCQQHSRDMADSIVPFGHDGFSERVDNIALELAISITAAGENVACNMGMSDPAQAAVDAWLASTGHRQNIEGDYRLTGVGVACPDNDSLIFYFTQIFIKD